MPHFQQPAASSGTPSTLPVLPAGARSRPCPRCKQKIRLVKWERHTVRCRGIAVRAEFVPEPLRVLAHNPRVLAVAQLVTAILDAPKPITPVELLRDARLWASRVYAHLGYQEYCTAPPLSSTHVTHASSSSSSVSSPSTSSVSHTTHQEQKRTDTPVSELHVDVASIPWLNAIPRDQKKHLPQDAVLLKHVRALRPPGCTTGKWWVLDVGGGNGAFCLLCIQLGASGVVVDPKITGELIESYVSKEELRRFHRVSLPIDQVLWDVRVSSTSSPAAPAPTPASVVSASVPGAAVLASSTIHATVASKQTGSSNEGKETQEARQPFPASPIQPWVFVCKHLCGGGIDAMLRRAVSVGAPTCAIVAATCCFHKSTWSDYCNPEFLTRLGITAASYNVLARASGWASLDHTIKRPRQGADALQLLGVLVARIWDLGRIRFLEAHGFKAYRTQYIDSSLTPVNGLLLAVPAKDATAVNALTTLLKEPKPPAALLPPRSMKTGKRSEQRDQSHKEKKQLSNVDGEQASGSPIAAKRSKVAR